MSQSLALNRRKFFLIFSAIGSASLAFTFFYFALNAALEQQQTRAWLLAVCTGSLFVASFFASGALRSERLELYKQIFERSNDAIAVISPKGNYIAQNEAHRKLIGFDDQKLATMTPCYYAGSRLKTVDELALLHSFSGEFKVEKYGGTLIDVSLSAYTVVDELNDPMFFVENKRDIGEFKKIQEEIKAAHASIKDSINYASRIQRSFLPDNDSFLEKVKTIKGQTSVKDIFVYWHPKDTIGGDCYWFEVYDDGFFAAIIDCTGHGVPGSMMTFVVLSLLRGYCADPDTAKKPSLIMSAMNNSIKEALGQQQDGSESDDGMDAAFLYFDLKNSTLRYCGANISLFSQANETEEPHEIRPDKSSVGYAHIEADKIYSEQVLNIDKGMRFYLSTDGILDQIGGQNRLSFGKKRFKKAILEHSAELYSEQMRSVLDDFFEYKGDEKQRDDNTALAFYF